MTPEDNYYRIEKLLPSGEWYTWTSRLKPEEIAREYLEYLEALNGRETFRLVRCVVSKEVVDG